MIISVKKESMPSHITGGGYGISQLEVYVDERLSATEQREVVLHEILEGYLPHFPHDAIDELTDLLMTGLEQLEWGAE